MVGSNLPEVRFDPQNHAESKDYFLATCSERNKNRFFSIINSIGLPRNSIALSIEKPYWGTKLVILLLKTAGATGSSTASLKKAIPT